MRNSDNLLWYLCRGARGLVLAIFVGTVGLTACATEPSNSQTVGLERSTQFFLQEDPRWARERLGGSGETIARSGCTLCSVSMALTMMGFDLDPKRLNASLRARNGYTSRGWLKWGALTAATGNQVGVVMDNAPTITKIDRALAQGSGVVGQIRTSRGSYHWVYVVGKRGGEYVVRDPAARTPVESTLTGNRIRAIRVLTRRSS